MSAPAFRPLGALGGVEAFRSLLAGLGLDIPCDLELVQGGADPLAQPLDAGGGAVLGNRWAVHPMEGWDGTADGRPTERTFRRWRRFGSSAAKLVWGGEAVAVLPEARANPFQLCIGPDSAGDLAALRTALAAAHRQAAGSERGLLVGLQLTHSGRFSHERPLIAHRHPVLDRRMGLGPDHPLLSDGEIRAVVQAFLRAARTAREAGFDFVDLKHCHGYLGHELLSAQTREGDYGGPFEHRTRFLRELVGGVRAEAPGLLVGVRVSAFDTVPYRADPATGVGIPEPCPLPYRWGFGVDPLRPTEPDLTEAVRLLALLKELDVRLVNVSAGSPYTNPHVQRPALHPPSDGYLPPEDPLRGVARQMQAVRDLKRRIPGLVLVGSAYSYLQEFLPHVAQAAVREGWTDCVGLGRMALSYPEMPSDRLRGEALKRRLICRTFSDCTTAPRRGLPSGCYPLDEAYRASPEAARLRPSP